MKRLLLVALCAFALSAQATSLVYKDMNALVGEADAIVVGTVQEVTAQRGEDDQIYTYVRLAELRMLGGRYSGQELTLILEGGFDGREGVDIPGSPEFQPQERVVLFVAGNGERVVPLVGWGQGVFKLTRDARGNTIVTDEIGNPVYDLSATGEVLKARHRPSRAEIVGAPHLAHAHSAEVRGFSPGIPDHGVTGVRSGPEGKPMSADRFLKQVQERAKGRQYGAEIRSARVGQALARRGSR